MDENWERSPCGTCKNGTGVEYYEGPFGVYVDQCSECGGYGFIPRVPNVKDAAVNETL